jgi:hypothetical protein
VRECEAGCTDPHTRPPLHNVLQESARTGDKVAVPTLQFLSKQIEMFTIHMCKRRIPLCQRSRCITQSKPCNAVDRISSEEAVGSGSRLVVSVCVYMWG